MAELSSSSSPLSASAAASDYESLGPIFDYFFGSDLGRRVLRITLLTYLDALELFRLRLSARRFRDELPNRVASLTFITAKAQSQENPGFSARLAAIFLKGISPPPIDPGWVFLAPILS